MKRGKSWFISSFRETPNWLYRANFPENGFLTFNFILTKYSIYVNSEHKRTEIGHNNIKKQQAWQTFHNINPLAIAKIRLRKNIPNMILNTFTSWWKLESNWKFLLW